MKKAVTLIVCSFLLATFFPFVATAVSAQIPLYVNGMERSDHPPPKIVGNVPFLDIETLADVLEGKVEWTKGNDTVEILSKRAHIVIASGSSTVRVNGYSYELGALPLHIDDTLYIPIEKISKPIGIKYIWDKLTRSLFLYIRGETAGNPMDYLDGISEGPNETLSPKPHSEKTGVQLHIAENQVVILSDQTANPRHFILKDQIPFRIVLDYPAAAFGHTANSNPADFIGEVTAEGPLMKKVRYGLNDPMTLRFVIELTGDANYTVVPNADGTQTIITLQEKAHPTYKIVIDAGHGGKDPGAEGHSKRHEKWFTLDLSKKVYDLMAKEPALAPFMTRSDDSFLSLEERAAYANDLQADLFISIHGNTFEQAVSGTETYYYSQQGKAFAEVMHKHVVQATGLRDRGVREEKYQVLWRTKMPAALLELGYLTTKGDEDKMLTDEFQDDVAAAIVAAVKEYLNIS